MANLICSTSWLGLVLGSCVAVSPDPAVMAADLPPPVVLDATTLEATTQRTGQAVLALESGRIDAAHRLALAALELNPRDAVARAVVARWLWEDASREQPPRLYGWRQAEGELRRASALAPADPLVARLHAQFLEQDGHLTAAADRCELTLALAPAAVELRGLAGRLRYELRQPTAARVHLEPYLVARPDAAEARYRLAAALLEIAAVRDSRTERGRDYQSAAEHFAAYSALEPGAVDGPLGEAYARQMVLRAQRSMDPTAAAAVLALYARVTELAPARADGDFGRGVVLERLDRIEPARFAYRAALRLDPGYLPALVNLALLEADHEVAVALWERAAQVAPDAAERRQIENWIATRRAEAAVKR